MIRRGAPDRLAASDAAEPAGVRRRRSERRTRPRRSGPTPRAAVRERLRRASAPDGDYEIQVCGDHVPPAPWANVIANPHGGFVVTERGGGFTWAENSYFFRLTPWHNDPVSDPASEVALPARRGDRRALVRRRRRRSGVAPPTPSATARAPRRSSIEQRGIATALTLGMAEDAAVKLADAAADQHRRRGRAGSPLTVVRRVDASASLREHTQHQVRTAFDRAQQGDPRAEHLRPAVRRRGRRSTP